MNSSHVILVRNVDSKKSRGVGGAGVPVAVSPKAYSNSFEKMRFKIIFFLYIVSKIFFKLYTGHQNGLCNALKNNYMKVNR